MAEENKKDKKAKTEKTSSGLKGFRNFMIAVVIALALRFFVMEPFQIPTGSMEPTLIGREGYGDRIFAGKFSYSKRFGSDPKRWDVVVFYLNEPGEGKKRLVKRLIGLPNETIEICDGDIYANGEIARKPEDLQKVLWHRLYDGNYSSPMEMRHWPWIVENGPIDAWMPDGNAFLVSNDRADAQPATIKYDGSRRGIRLTNIYIRHSYRSYKCPVCGEEVFWPVDTAHTWVNCPVCSMKTGRPVDFNICLRDLFQNQYFAERYPGNSLEEVPVNDLAVEAEWMAKSETGGDVILQISSRGRNYSARFMPGSDYIVITCPDEKNGQENVKIQPGAGNFHMRLAFWDSTLVVYWNDEEVFKKELPPYKRLAELAREESEVRITVGRGITSFKKIAIDRDIYYTDVAGMERSVMSRSAYGLVYNIGTDEYFFMGDNSPSSRDSRFWGTIKREDLVGKAWFVFWPLQRIRWIK